MENMMHIQALESWESCLFMTNRISSGERHGCLIGVQNIPSRTVTLICSSNRLETDSIENAAPMSLQPGSHRVRI